MSKLNRFALFMKATYILGMLLYNFSNHLVKLHLLKLWCIGLVRRKDGQEAFVSWNMKRKRYLLL